MFPITCNAFGDIVAVIQIVRDIATALNDARGAAVEYQRLVHELNMLSIVIEEAYHIALSSQDDKLRVALLDEVRRCSENDVAEACKLLPGYERLAQSPVGETSKLARAQLSVKKLKWHFLKASDAAAFAKRFRESQQRINNIIAFIHHRQLQAISDHSQQNYLSTAEQIAQASSRLQSSIDNSTSTATDAVYESSHEIRQDFSELRQEIIFMTTKFTTTPSQRDSALVNRICDTLQNRLSPNPRTPETESERQRFKALLVPYCFFSVAIVSQVTLGPGLRTPALWATIIALILHVLHQQSFIPTSVWGFSENVIILIDVLGERMPVALQLCVSIEHFHKFLDNFYTTNERKGADYVRNRAYELYGTDETQALTSSSWSRYIAAGAKIEMGILLRRTGWDRSAPVCCPWCAKEVNGTGSSYTCTSCIKSFMATREFSSPRQFKPSSPCSHSKAPDAYGHADVKVNKEPQHPPTDTSNEDIAPLSANERKEYRDPNVVQYFRRIHVVETVVTVHKFEPHRTSSADKSLPGRYGPDVPMPLNKSGLEKMPSPAVPVKGKGVLGRIVSAFDRFPNTSPADGPGGRTPILDIPESKKPEYAVHWRLLPYDPQDDEPRLHYDVRLSPDTATWARGQDHFPINTSALEKPAIKNNLSYMTFTTEDLPIFDLEVHRLEGVRVRDVLERIYEHYKLVLTRTEKALHRERVERAQPYYEERVRFEHQRDPSYIDHGMRRIDLLEGNVFFMGCQWNLPCEEHPDGSWALMFGPTSPPE